MAADSNAERMTDYLDDALDGAEAESFAQLLAASPEAAMEADALKRMLSLVRELPELSAPPDFYEKVAKKLRRPRAFESGAGMITIPLQVVSIIVILVIAAGYLMLEIEREDAQIEKDPTAKPKTPSD